MGTTHYNFTEISNTDALDVAGDLDKNLEEIDSAIYGVEKKADAAAVDAASAKATAVEAKATAEEVKEAAVSGIGASFDTGSRELTIIGLNSDGNEKTRANVTVPGGGSADVNVIAPLVVETAAVSGGEKAIAIGDAAEAAGGFSVVVGNYAKAYTIETADHDDGTAIGTSAKTYGSSVVAIGSGARAGEGSTQQQTNSTAIGATTRAGRNSTAIGANSNAADDAVAIGYLSVATEEDTVSFGRVYDATGLELTKRLVHVGAPTADSDAATKAYVDAAIASLISDYGLTKG